MSAVLLVCSPEQTTQPHSVDFVSFHLSYTVLYSIPSCYHVPYYYIPTLIQYYSLQYSTLSVVDRPVTCARTVFTWWRGKKKNNKKKGSCAGQFLASRQNFLRDNNVGLISGLRCGEAETDPIPVMKAKISETTSLRNRVGDGGTCGSHPAE